jgi:hypothetical protein
MFKELAKVLEDNIKNIESSYAEIIKLDNLISANINNSEQLRCYTDSIDWTFKSYLSHCRERVLLLEISKVKITWKNTLQFHNLVGRFSDGKKKAQDLGYQFFIWNDIIYSTKLDGMIKIGLIEDLDNND